MTPTRAVIPAAGWGTRFLPVTKSVPKELLPVIDRPMIDYAVAEAAAAGITDVVLVVSEGKEAIERHFEPLPELEAALEASGKAALLAEVRRASALARIEAVVQEEQLGLGHAVATAGPLVGGDPFVVLLPDEIVTGGLLSRMIDVFARNESSVIGLMAMPRSELSAYGVPEVEPTDEDGVVLVRSIIEKPSPGDAPSDFATIGRYVFTPDILDALERVEPGVGGEIQLTDAIDILAGKQPVHGVVAQGGRWDAGNPVGLLRASLELALARDDLADDVRTLVADVASRHGITLS